jgi:hypothetical protein
MLLDYQTVRVQHQNLKFNLNIHKQRGIHSTYYFHIFQKHEFYYHKMLENYLHHCKDNLNYYRHVPVHNQRYYYRKSLVKKNKMLDRFTYISLVFCSNNDSNN